MFSRICSCSIVVFACLFAAACDDTPFDPSTTGSQEGNRCELKQSGQCGSGLECYVPPNCSFAVCCPPQDPTNPTCYCASANGGGGDGGGEGAADDASTVSDVSQLGARVSD